jgi:hypothetical protein
MNLGDFGHMQVAAFTLAVESVFLHSIQPVFHASHVLDLKSGVVLAYDSGDGVILVDGKFFNSEYYWLSLRCLFEVHCK